MAEEELKIYPVRAGFPSARARFRTEFKTRRNHPTIRDVFSPKTLAHLRGAKYADENFEPLIQRRVLYWVGQQDRRSFYQELEGRIGQTVSDRAALRARWTGRFSYFRYHSMAGYTDLHVRRGRIEIRSDAEGEVLFSHWSQDWSPGPADEPEHTGHCFLKEGHLFMLGSREAVLRLAVVRDHGRDLARHVCDGLVLSVRSRLSSEPFAALTVMVREDNEEALAKFGESARWVGRPAPVSLSPEVHEHELDRHIQPNLMKFLSL